MKINIANLTKSRILRADFFNKVAAETLKFVDFDFLAGNEINLVFVSEKRIKELNKIWRGREKATDVLSFSAIDMPQGGLARKLKLENALKKSASTPKPVFKNKNLFDNENQIIICLSYAKKQAKELKISLKQNLARLFSHGILHILGYDHERSMEENEIMDDLQVVMMKKFK